MLIEIVTPAGACYKDEIDSVVLPTPLGYIEVFKGHTCLINKIKIGVIKIKKNNKEEKYVSLGGIGRIDNKEVHLILHGFEDKNQIDFTRAENSKTRAEERLKSKDPNIDLKRAEISLQRALARLSLRD